MIKIGLIGTLSMHAWSFAEACNVPDENGNYRNGDARVTALWGVDDTEEHIKFTIEKGGNIPVSVNSLEEMYDKCNAFMVLGRNGSEHLGYAEEIIKKGYPVFIDKPVCSSVSDIKRLKELAEGYDNVILGGSGLKHIKDLKELKEKITEEKFGKINGATINHSADINCPYEGIFFYLPHAVEMMLELFGYDPVSVNTTVLAPNNFTVCVKYSDKLINLVISSCRPTYVVINGEQSEAKEIESSDIFRDEMKAFVKAIEENKPCKDVSKLTEHVSVILAVNESIKTKGEVPIEKFRL